MESGGGATIRGMENRWSVREIVESLEAQALLHRDRARHHAEHEEFHRELRSRHEAELEAVTRRLEQFRSAAAEAVELAERSPSPRRPPVKGDFGPASRPRLAKMVLKVVEEVRPTDNFGPGWVTQEINRRFGDHLRRQVDVRQVSAVLRRFCREGNLHQYRRGRPRHEARYTREKVEG